MKSKMDLTILSEQHQMVLHEIECMKLFLYRL